MDNLTVASLVGVLSFLALIFGLVSQFVKLIDRAKTDSSMLTEMKISLQNINSNTTDSNLRIKALEDEVMNSKMWREKYSDEVIELIEFKDDQKLVNHETKTLLTAYDKLINKNKQRLDELEKRETDFK